MTPRRPYLVRAIYDWIVDNQLTPHLVVNAEYPGCDVPWDFVQDGQIILNVSPTAVAKLQMNIDAIEFNARFSGRDAKVYIPIGAVLALYARENGAGTIFEPESYYDQEQEKPKQKPSGPHLRVVK